MILYHFTCSWKFWGDDSKSGYDPERRQLMVRQRDLIPANEPYDWEGCPALVAYPGRMADYQHRDQASREREGHAVASDRRLSKDDLRMLSFHK